MFIYLCYQVKFNIVHYVTRKQHRVKIWDTDKMDIRYTNDNIAVLSMNYGENRINLSFLKDFNKALDEIERNKKCRGLITTGNGKFYSNGLDLKWIQKQEPEAFEKFRKYHVQTVRRIMHLGIPTVAALNGHAFAAGAFFALSHDYRVMRSDRGWITWNETINGSRFPQSSIEFAKVKLPQTRTMRDAIIFAKRFTAQEAKQYGIVDVVTELSDLIEESKTLINKVLGPGGIDKDMLTIMKLDILGLQEYQKSKL